MPKTFFLISLMYFIVSCERPANFQLPAVISRYAILSSNDPDTKFKVRITIAKPYQDPNITVSEQCSVMLFENDKLLRNLQADTSKDVENLVDRSQKYPSRIFTTWDAINFVPGFKYSISVTIPDHSSLSSSSVFPKPVNIKSITWKEINLNMPPWYSTSIADSWVYYTPADPVPPLIEWTIILKDPPDVVNYYRLGIGYKCKLFNQNGDPYSVYGKVQYAMIDENDPVFMYVINWHSGIDQNPVDKYNMTINKEVLFNDYNFNGNELSLKFLTARPSCIIHTSDTNSVFKYIINLYSLSEDYYKYWLDRYVADKTAIDPFAEPVRVHNNIENGAGIFAFSSLVCDTIPVKINLK